MAATTTSIPSPTTNRRQPSAAPSSSNPSDLLRTTELRHSGYLDTDNAVSVAAIDDRGGSKLSETKIDFLSIKQRNAGDSELLKAAAAEGDGL